MMETPVIYHEAAIAPFAHLDDSARNIIMSVFYAKNRQPQDRNKDLLPYKNTKDEMLYLGSRKKPVS